MLCWEQWLARMGIFLDDKLMSVLIILFGVLTLLAGALIVIEPERIWAPIRKNIESPSLYAVAVVRRLILGLLLLRQAEFSRMPFVIEVIGWLSLAAACTFALIGRSRFVRLMRFALSLAQPLGRIGGLIAIIFGAFLVYAFS